MEALGADVMNLPGVVVTVLQRYKDVHTNYWKSKFFYIYLVSADDDFCCGQSIILILLRLYIDNKNLLIKLYFVFYNPRVAYNGKENT